MKLVRSTSGGAFAALSFSALLALTCASAVAACGCSATAPAASRVATASNSNVAGTTNLMSAEIPGPAPKVGKAHLAIDEADSDAVDATPDANDLTQPKDARPSDGSRRGGGFGTSSK
ncbi:MAG: hypothetical protein JWO86_8027 [Myxococcaceae bacterium]|nr:hypothetical protein [Myxococcaceae bacterium]MEA2747422.1 hypothetical protein [Myxococcales bacterium]